MLFGKHVNHYYKKYWPLFLVGILMLILVDTVQLFIPVYLGKIVDMFKNNVISGHEAEINHIIFAVLGIAFCMFAGRVIWRLTIFKASSGIEANMRHEMFLKAEKLSQSYFRSNKVGTIINWFTTDIFEVKDYFGWGTIMMVDAYFMSVLTLTFMFLLNWVLSLVTLVPIALIIVWGVFVEKHMSMKWANRQKVNDQLYDFSQENFTGIRVIKAFVKENQQLHAFAKVARKNHDMNIDYVRVSVKFDVFIAIIIAITMSLILGVGGWIAYCAILNKPIMIFTYQVNLTAGELIQFLGFFDMLVWPLMALGQIFTMKSRAKGSLKRISSFLDLPEDIVSPENAIKFNKDSKGNIKFNHLSFVYPDGNTTSLNDINCEIKAGETVGIVGKIGSGKTTLVNCLLRLYNLDKGSLFIDGVDVMDADIQSLRDIIGYVPQDNFLFSDKISNNIAFSKEMVSSKQVEEAAEFADVHDNIINFKEGYNTISGERGVTLSGGQKQRISIARAYIKDAPIMIMDDSVSAVDVKTEENILKHIKEKRAGQTTIIVASRISTVQSLDKIMVLDNGHLEAFGSHDELIKTSPTYKKLAYLQKLEDEVEGGKK